MAHALDDERRSAVLAQLARLLDSPHFRNSKRAQSCLDFIVRQTLANRADQLKERCIGIEVFGRDADYDTGADSIVRVAANELRKKLAQYYVHAPADEPLIELAPGSYVPEFRFPEASRTASSDSTPELEARGWKRISGKRLVAPLAVIALVAAAGAWVLYSRAFQPDRAAFWSPVLTTSRPVLVCIGNPVVYLLSKRIHNDYRKAHPDEVKSGPYVIRLDPDSSVSASDIVPALNQFVGAGDAQAVATLATLFARMDKPFEVRAANEVSYSDLKSRPVVFIGFSNNLHLEMTRHLRFNFVVESDGKLIRDSALPGRVYRLNNIKPDGRTEMDYALVSRIIHSDSGLPLVQVAGITNYGSRAAAEFLGDTSRLEAALKLTPPNWKGNLQILLKCGVIGDSPTPASVVAVHTW
jgi:hypothetical protein